MARLLLVDDEPNVLRALKRVLSLAGDPPLALEAIETCELPRQALERLHEQAYDLILSDYRMPEMDGVAFLSAARQLQPDCARLILSAQADLQGLIGAINQAGIQRFIMKPWNDLDLRVALAEALEHRALLLENRRLADEVRMARGVISHHEVELRRLEEESPGITKVKWGPDGSVLLEDD
jgi:two-component system, probable response regulator PhcQ